LLVSKPEFADIFVVYDMYNLVGRVEHAPCGILTNSQGYPTNALDIGLSKIKAMAEHADVKNKRVCLAFSAYENSGVRRAVYPKYKEGRIKNEPVSFDLTWWDGTYRTQAYDGVRDLMDLIQNIPSLTIGVPNCDGETDDAIATFCYAVAPKPVFVVTEDRDMWSLMSKRVRVFSKPDKEYGIPDLTAKFFITEPRKLGLAKALFGDDSDKIDPIVARISKDQVAPKLESCRIAPGEKHFAPAFFREIEGLEGSSFKKLLAAREEVAYAERWIKLRRVELNYRHGTRNPSQFQQILEFAEVKKKLPKFLEFANA
jgi:5'-3' exonuclease